MAYTIYGGYLKPGHCEVHPDITEEYPCRKCYEEKIIDQQQQEEEKIINQQQQEEEYYQQQGQQEDEGST